MRASLREDLYFRINTITAARAAAARADARTFRSSVIISSKSSTSATRSRCGPIFAGGLPPADPEPLVRQRPRAGERHRARRAGEQDGRDPPCHDLPESRSARKGTSTQEFTIPPHRTLAEIEKMANSADTQRTNWNKQEAAQILGLYRPKRCNSKMKKHAIRDNRASRREAAQR